MPGNVADATDTRLASPTRYTLRPSSSALSSASHTSSLWSEESAATATRPRFSDFPNPPTRRPVYPQHSSAFDDAIPLETLGMSVPATPSQVLSDMNHDHILSTEFITDLLNDRQLYHSNNSQSRAPHSRRVQTKNIAVRDNKMLFSSQAPVMAPGAEDYSSHVVPQTHRDETEADVEFQLNYLPTPTSPYQHVSKNTLSSADLTNSKTTVIGPQLESSVEGTSHGHSARPSLDGEEAIIKSASVANAALRHSAILSSSSEPRSVVGVASAAYFSHHDSNQNRIRQPDVPTKMGTYSRPPPSAFQASKVDRARYGGEQTVYTLPPQSSAISLADDHQSNSSRVSLVAREANPSDEYEDFPLQNDVHGPPKSTKKRSSKTTSISNSLLVRLSLTASDKSKSSRSIPSRSRFSILSWIQRKELPPLPPDAQSSSLRTSQKVATSRESLSSLPVMVSRAENLSRMLETSVPSEEVQPVEWKEGLTRDTARNSTTQYGKGSHRVRWRETSWTRIRHELSEKRSKGGRMAMPLWAKVCLVAFAFLVIAGIAVAIGLLVRRPEHKKSQISCQGNFAGSDCSLDATCVCTSSSPGTCTPLASAMVAPALLATQLFNTSITSSTLALALFNTQGAVTQQNCAMQAGLIDVSPALMNTSSERRAWSQAAIVWNFFLSRDLGGTERLRAFVANSDISDTLADDSAVDKNGYNVVVDGYNFDFARLHLAPVTLDWATTSSAPATQLSALKGSSQTVLNRMLSFASASSSQQESALSYFWGTVVQRTPSQLQTFLRIVNSSPVLLAFDATQDVATSLLQQNPSSFPPPNACFPSVTIAQKSLVNLFQSAAFGIPSLSNSVNLTACPPEQPVYGILNVLRQREVFFNEEDGRPRQVVEILPEASLRAVIAVGDFLETLPGQLSNDNTSLGSPDPRTFGTLFNLNHVVLSWLTSITNHNSSMLNVVVDYILNANPAVSTDSLQLGKVLSSTTVPRLTAAVFGEVRPSDVNRAISNFASPNGALFFGSDVGQVFRNWALNSTSSSDIAWTIGAGSDEVVRETKTADATFEQVWSGANSLISEAAKANRTTGQSEVETIVEVFQNISFFGS